MIKDAANPVLTHRAHPYSSSCMTHYEGPSISSDTIESPSLSIDINMES